MRVLKHGNKYEKCFTCPICQCVFIGVYYEVVNDKMICPECGSSMDWNEGADYLSTGRLTCTPDFGHWSDSGATANFEPDYTIITTNYSDAR